MHRGISGLALLCLLSAACSKPSVGSSTSHTRLTVAMVEADIEPRWRDTGPGGDMVYDVAQQYQHTLIKTLKARAEKVHGWTDIQIKPGSDFAEVIIDIPSSRNVDQVRRALVWSPSVGLYHAKTISTIRADRPYLTIGPDESHTVPTVHFLTRSGEEIRFVERSLPPVGTKKRAATPYEKLIESWTLILDASEIREAKPMSDRGRFMPQIYFTEEGTKKLELFCRRYANQGENLAFVVDGRVVSIAPLKDGSILRDNAYISGNFEAEYVKALVDAINAGAMPVRITEKSIETV